MIAVSAFSGMAGALLSQAIAAVNTYFTDKRKQAADLQNQYRNKKIEIGENFYYISGEIMTVLRKNISFWKNWHTSRSEASIAALNKELVKFTAALDKLYAENWKYNLVSLYFTVSFDPAELSESNALSQKYYLSVLDKGSAIKQAREEDKEALLGDYAFAVFDMCAHYEEIYRKIVTDRAGVKAALERCFR